MKEGDNVTDEAEDFDGPFDIEDFDDPESAKHARLDLGSVLVPMPAAGQATQTIYEESGFFEASKLWGRHFKD